MKANILLILLTCLCLSCSDDNTPEPGTTDPDNPDVENTIPEKYLGKWKVEYSKTIEGARFQDDGTLEIADEAVIKEYLGDYNGHENTSPKSGMFVNDETKIEILKDNKIVSSPSYGDNKTVNINIEDNLLIWTNSNNRVAEHYFYWDNDLLVIERIPTQQFKWIYTISKYSKIKD